MIKHTQTIRGLLPTNCLSVFDHFMELALQAISDQCSISTFPNTIEMEYWLKMVTDPKTMLTDVVPVSLLLTVNMHLTTEQSCGKLSVYLYIRIGAQGLP